MAVVHGLELLVDPFPGEMLMTGSLLTDDIQTITWSVIPRLALVSFLIWVILRQLKRLAARFQAETSVQPGWAILCGILLGYSTLMFFGYAATTTSSMPQTEDLIVRTTTHFLEHGWAAAVLAIGASLGVLRFHHQPSQSSE